MWDHLKATWVSVSNAGVYFNSCHINVSTEAKSWIYLKETSRQQKEGNEEMTSQRPSLNWLSTPPPCPCPPYEGNKHSSTEFSSRLMSEVFQRHRGLQQSNYVWWPGNKTRLFLDMGSVLTPAHTNWQFFVCIDHLNMKPWTKTNTKWNY